MATVDYKPWLVFSLGILFLTVMLVPLGERAVHDLSLRERPGHISIVATDRATTFWSIPDLRIPEPDGDPLPSTPPFNAGPVAAGSAVPTTGYEDGLMRRELFRGLELPDTDQHRRVA